MRFMRKVRNKLFLNAVRSVVHEESRNIIENFEQLTENVLARIKELNCLEQKIILSLDSLMDCQKIFLLNATRDAVRQELNAVHSHIQDACMEEQKKVRARLDDIYYNQQVLTQVPTVHKYFSQFKGIYEGKDVVQVSGGPTLNQYRPIPDAVHVGINAVFRSFSMLDYLFLNEQHLLDSTLNDEADAFKPDTCKKFYSILPYRRSNEVRGWKTLSATNEFVSTSDRIPEIRFKKANAYPVLLEEVYSGKFAIDLQTEAFGDFGGTVFTALQFIMYTHPRRVFLVGHDCTTAGHAYQTEIDKKLLPFDFSQRIGIYKAFKEWANRIYPDVEIISVNPIGLKGIFKDWYQAEGDEPNGE